MMSQATEPAHVLIVEDDHAVVDVLRRYLEREAHTVSVAYDGRSGLQAARDLGPDLLVLDVMLPHLSGLEVCSALRQEDGSDVPIIMLTALGETDDRIAGLAHGADDYVVKPFSVKELTLRIGSVLRRTAAAPPGPRAVSDVLTDDDLVLEPTARRAALGGQGLPLTTREFDLLAFLLAHPGEVFSREELLQHVWGWDFGDQSTVTVHVKRLRHKIERTPAEPTRLVTVYGRGYRYDPVGSRNGGTP